MTDAIKFRCFALDLGRKVHHLGSDLFKIMLTNQEPKAGDRRHADIIEIAVTSNYPAGGVIVEKTAFQEVAEQAVLTGDDVVIAALAAPIGPFRYGVLYNATAKDGPLIRYYDRGQSIILDPRGPDFVAFRFPRRQILSLE